MTGGEGRRGVVSEIRHSTWVSVISTAYEGVSNLEESQIFEGHHPILRLRGIEASFEIDGNRQYLYRC